MSRKPRPSPNEANGLPAIYIVEDDHSVRTAIIRLLVSMRCAVYTFVSAEQFLAEVPPDACGCLVLDVRLPGMSGLQLLEQVVHARCKLRTIVISAEFTERAKEDALRLGAIAVMEKPFDRAQFLATVQTAITDRSAD